MVDIPNKALTIVIPNRDRIDFNSRTTELMIESLNNQTNKNFEIIIVDGGSRNIGEIKKHIRKQSNIWLIEHKTCEKFHKTALNNIGIRSAKTKYVMTTDADMYFAPKFIEVILDNCKDESVMVESRTMYWNKKITEKIHKKELDLNNIDGYKIGRLKGRTTCGGCQCTHIDNWNMVGGYDERYIGWGSEDRDLLARMQMANIKVIWLGESVKEVMLFHQHHDKENIKQNLDDQEKNKVFLNNIKTHIAGG